MTLDHSTATDWTDRHLDAVLDRLQGAAVPDEPELTNVRAAILREAQRLSAAGPAVASVRPVRPVRRSRPQWRRPLLIAAAVVALVAGGLTIPLLRGPGLDAAAAAALDQAADAADRAAASGTDVIPAGHYRYTVTDAWYLTTSPDYSYRQQSRQQVWMPADWHDTWLERRSSTGAREWIHGSEPAAVAAGLAKDDTPSVEPDYRGSCAGYFTNVCTGAGSWQAPTQEWIAGLPKDPTGMYTRLSGDSEGHGQSQESEMLVQATDALRTGLLPAGVRATLYRAMAKINGVAISDNAVTLDGSVGTGFTVSSPWIRGETIIDPQTGEYIGTRETLVKDDPTSHLKAGTLLGYTAVTSTVVTKLGATR